MKKEDVFYRAMIARDHRFDGKFFVGVKTTGIYCRPICPAKPKRENVEFFPNHLEAERAGYRPCLRCRPESAPSSPAWGGTSAVVRRAVKALGRRESLAFHEDEFAAQFGVTARHLRRLFAEEIGKTPKQLAFENRLNLARKLIVGTSLPLTEVAFASGFESVRRFNSAFKDRFKKAPREIRKTKASRGKHLRIPIPYRPPFDFEGLMKSYESHRVGRLEVFRDGCMHRFFEMNGQAGEVRVSNEASSSRLWVEIDFPETAMIHAILSRVRAMFDLDSDPVLIANAMEAHPELRRLLRRYPGIRLPSGWDGFEVAVATILGQLVSVGRGRALVEELIELAGRDSGLQLEGRPVRFFPSPRELLAADLSALKTTRQRKDTLKSFARAVVERRISLEPAQDVDEFIEKLLEIRGIGPWTAQYMAMKVLRDTDAFPGTDLILARMMKSGDGLETLSPWRAYAAALLWRHHGDGARGENR